MEAISHADSFGKVKCHFRCSNAKAVLNANAFSSHPRCTYLAGTKRKTIGLPSAPEYAIAAHKPS